MYVYIYASSCSGVPIASIYLPSWTPKYLSVTREAKGWFIYGSYTLTDPPLSKRMSFFSPADILSMKQMMNVIYSLTTSSWQSNGDSDFIFPRVFWLVKYSFLYEIFTWKVSLLHENYSFLHFFSAIVCNSASVTKPFHRRFYPF